MNVAFKKITLPEEQDILIDWLTSDEWPFHVNAQLTASTVLEILEEGMFAGKDKQIFWIVIDDKYIGFIRIFDLDDGDEYWSPLFDLRLLSAWRGRGVGRIAVRWLVDHLFRTWPALTKIDGETRADNIAMRKVFKNCGFVKEAHFRKTWWTKTGERHDGILYSILKEDWTSNTTTPVNWNDEPVGEDLERFFLTVYMFPSSERAKGVTNFVGRLHPPGFRLVR